ncbi:zf-HC2 domain-containing protein [Candidatus Sumerlaeota bacterium]|nr:zf-HC2 domain-containing protein [Candidatus Sumerlaeota bacterium]
MKLTCEKIHSLITRAADGELEEGLRAEIVAHARGCPLCAEAWNIQTRVDAALRRAPLAAPPPLYFEGVLAEVHRKMPDAPDRAAKFQKNRIQPQTLASGFMAALILLWLGVSVNFRIDFATSGGARTPAASSSLSRMASASANAPRMVASLVYVQGMGWISSNSELLKLPPSALRELGLVPIKFRGRWPAITAIL